MSELKKLTNVNFKEEIQNKTLIDFYGEFCGPCKMLSPLLERIAKDNSSITFGKVDIDESSDLASEYKIMSVPTLILFENGKEINRLVGLQPEQKIREVLG